MRAIEGEAANPTQRTPRPIPQRRLPLAEHIVASVRDLRIDGPQDVQTAVFQTHHETDEFLSVAAAFLIERRVRQLIVAHSESRLFSIVPDILNDLRGRIQIVQGAVHTRADWIDSLDPPYSLIVMNHRTEQLSLRAEQTHPCNGRIYVHENNLRPDFVEAAFQFAQRMHAQIGRVFCSGQPTEILATPWMPTIVAALVEHGFLRIQNLRLDLTPLTPKPLVLYTQNSQLAGSNPEFIASCRELLLWNTDFALDTIVLWMRSQWSVTSRLLAISVDTESDARLLMQNMARKSLLSIESWIISAPDILVLNEITQDMPRLSLRPALARLTCTANRLSSNDVGMWTESVVRWLGFLAVAPDNRLKTLTVERAHDISDADLGEIVSSGLHLVRVAMQNRAIPTSMIRDPTLRLIAAAFRAGVHQIEFYSSITHSKRVLSVSEL